MPETKERKPLEISIQDYDRVIAEIAEADQLSITPTTKRFVRDELLTLIFGEKFEGWFFGFKRVFTILFVPLLFFWVVVWLLFVAYFLWYAAFHRDQFTLSDNVLIAMITSTTATVIGLFHYAARWMFAVNPKDPEN